MKYRLTVVTLICLCGYLAYATFFLTQESVQTEPPQGTKSTEAGKTQKPAALPQTTKTAETLDPEKWERIKKNIAERKLKSDARDAKFSEDMQALFKKLPVDPAVAAKLSQMEAEDMLPLLSSWGIPAEQIQRINDLVSKRNRKNDDLRRKRLVETDPAKIEMFRQDSATAETSVREELLSILGPEKMSQFEIWQNAKDERLHLSTFEAQLQTLNAPLDANQKQSVIDAMYQARQSVLQGRRLMSIDLYPEKAVEYQNEVLRLAEPILSSPQQQALRSYLNANVSLGRQFAQ